jgi:hypothetical protein
MLFRGLRHGLVRVCRPCFYNLGETKEILKKMATLTKPARVLGLTGCLGDLGIINTPSMIISNWWFPNMSGSGWKFRPLFIFLLLNLPFLLLLIH